MKLANVKLIKLLKLIFELQTLRFDEGEISNWKLHEQYINVKSSFRTWIKHWCSLQVQDATKEKLCTQDLDRWNNTSGYSLVNYLFV